MAWAALVKSTFFILEKDMSEKKAKSARGHFKPEWEVKYHIEWPETILDQRHRNCVFCR